MKTFEYSVLKLANDFTTETKIEQLSEIGEGGWELVTIFTQADTLECYFKRETDTVAEQAKEKLDDAIGAIKNFAGTAGNPGMGGLGSMFGGGQ